MNGKREKKGPSDAGRRSGEKKGKFKREMLKKYSSIFDIARRRVKEMTVKAGILSQKSAKNRARQNQLPKRDREHGYEHDRRAEKEIKRRRLPAWIGRENALPLERKPIEKRTR